MRDRQDRERGEREIERLDKWIEGGREYFHDRSVGAKDEVIKAAEETSKRNTTYYNETGTEG